MYDVACICVRGPTSLRPNVVYVWIVALVYDVHELSSNLCIRYVICLSLTVFVLFCGQNNLAHIGLTIFPGIL